MLRIAFFLLAAVCAADLRLENKYLDARLAPDGALRVRDKRCGREWRQQAAPGVTAYSAPAPMTVTPRDRANGLDLHAV